MGVDELRQGLIEAARKIQALRAENDELRARGDEPVAIVAMACRFPGEVKSPDDLWSLLERGADVIGPCPPDRGWSLADVGRRTPHLRGGFLRDAGEFDPSFFGISPREAAAIDPQQRLLLEASWEAIERAGIVPASLLGSPTGVFVGTAYQDYGSRTGGREHELEGHLGIGSAASVASGRIAYTLGLEGPTLTVDTACSASLVAVHLACQSLRRRECSLALAGGATVMSTPLPFFEFSKQGGLSSDGRCKAFSAGADGVGWAEGVGLLLLERLSDARRNGHPVLALVRGSAVNQDGRSQGLTAPNGPAQQRVIRAALASAGLSPRDIDAVEAHGTGTSLGDPIEAEALFATYGADRPEGRPLWLGSVKSNLGHTQAAAGVAGIIKLTLAMQRGLMPKTLHAERPSPHVDWSRGTVRLLDRPRSWEREGRRRLAAVSSFGISGTNAHVVLEEGDEPAARPDAPPPAVSPLPFLLSARAGDALRAQASELRSLLDRRPDLSPLDLASSLATSRTHFEKRAVVLAADRAGLAEALSALSSGSTPASVVEGEARRTGKLAALFTGQGAQRAGMGRELFGAFAAFREALEACFSAFEGQLRLPLQQVMFAEPGSSEAALLDQTELTQPALFAFEVAVFRLLESLGVKPDVLLGHSVGEIAAAHVAGVFSLDDACRLVAARGRLMQALPPGGAMVSLPFAEHEVRPLLAGREHEVAIAAVNGPRATVISGDEGAVLAIAARLDPGGSRSARLSVSHAFHSPRLDPMLDEFRRVAAKVAYRPSRLSVISNVTGKRATDAELSSPDHWVKQARQAVRFADGVRALEREQVASFVEVGPQATLSGLGPSCLAGEAQAKAAFLPASRKGKREVETLLRALAGLHVRGHAVDWASLFSPLCASRPVSLPTYPFQRQRYWLEAPAGSVDIGRAGLDAPEHPLLGAKVSLAGGGLVLTGRLSLADQPWLGDHQVFGQAIVPGTALLEIALAASRAAGLAGVDELTLEAPLALPAEGAVLLQVQVSEPGADGKRAISLFSRPERAPADAPFTRHASGVLGDGGSPPSPEPRVWPPEGASPLDVSSCHQKLEALGLRYGEAFRGLERAWSRGSEIFVEARLPAEIAPAAGGFVVHPALLDAALHALVLAGDGAARLPFSWSGVRAVGRGASALRVCLRPGPTPDAVGLTIADGSGEPIASIESLRAREASPSQPRPRPVADALYRVVWRTVSAPAGQADEGSWAVLSSRRGGAPLPCPPRVSPRVLDGMGALRSSLDEGQAAPSIIAVDLPATDERGQAALTVSRALASALDALRGFLDDDRLSASRLVIVTRGAVAALADDEVEHASHGAVWGAVRAAQLEHPGRGVAVCDLDARASSLAALGAAIATGEGQLALRDGALLAPRLSPAGEAQALPEGRAWRLHVEKPGTLDGLGFVAAPEVLGELGEGQVRVSIRASGVNFRDVMNALGMYPGEPGPLGLEGAGVVEATGPGSRLSPGDRVMGLFAGAFGPRVVADERTLARIPSGWSFRDAAAAPVAYLTALYALIDLGKLRAGETIVVHAGAGGVGMAAIALCRHLGVEVFATASPGKWGVLRALGLDEAHIASSRDASFEQRFLEATRGRGVDAVLNCLKGELIDASLRLLPRGGRFLEMGKTDLRDPAALALAHPGVRYQAFDLIEAGPERLGELLGELCSLARAGSLAPLPASSWDLRDAREAFRHMARARHVGKLTLVPPRALDPKGTVLVTGATGALGALLASHLVARHGVRHLLLASRTGPSAEGAAELRARLEALGASVTLASCDMADRSSVERLLSSVGEEHPLTGVFHLAGVLDDAVLSQASPEQIARVLGPKAAGAAHLDELTRSLDLSAFVLFSSFAGVAGSAGQAAYAAANAYLDALASRRRSLGLPALSLAWGPWSGEGMAARLSAADRARLGRQGLLALSPDEGLALLDASLGRPEAQLSPVRLDLALLGAHADALPRLFSEVVTDVATETGAAAGADEAASDGAGRALLERLAGREASEVSAELLSLTRAEVARVIGLKSPGDVAPDRPLRDLGVDSLMAVDLRNRLAATTGLRLPATLAFDHPTAIAIAELLRSKLALSPGRAAATRAKPRRASTDEPIAIVSMACRFPGGADSPEAFWRALDEGRDAVGEVPAERWDITRYFDPDPEAKGKTYTKWGGFVGDVSSFDAAFFEISPREAVSVDPQERLLLETTWEAIERAGLAPGSLRGSQTGVYLGLCGSEYQSRVMADPAEINPYSLLGTAPSAMVGRLSYWLGLEGPSMPIDTACSSSLVAVHLACQGLRQGECDLALAGGVNLLLSPETYVYFSRLRAMSPTGRCRTFSADADGYVRAEGCGVVLLKRLSDAVRDGDTVLAVIRGSAVNQDGRSNGLTAPSGQAQKAVIRRALEASGLEPGRVSYVECHGTGTALGDPIEVDALAEVYGEKRPANEPLLLGSVKTNIGHAEGAAGVAGLIKTVLSLAHGRLPKTLHFSSPNPHLPWAELPVRVVAEPTVWASSTSPRRAGVSAFGFSGTNAHLIVEEAPRPRPGLAAAPDEGPHLFVLSARTEPALRAHAGRFAAHLAREADLSLADVCRSAASGRGHFARRLAVVIDTRDELISALEAHAAGRPHPGLLVGEARAEAGSPGPELPPASDPAGRREALRLVARRYVEGLEPDWAKVFPHGSTRALLPTYPFERRRYWVEAPSGRAGSRAEASGHPLLGGRLPLSSDQAVFEQTLSLGRHSFLADHRVFDEPVLPAAAYLDMALGAARELGLGEACVAALALRRALTLPSRGAQIVQLTVAPEADGGSSFRLCSRPEGSPASQAWVLHATGSLQASGRAVGSGEGGFDREAIGRRCRRPIDVGALYEALSSAGLSYGPAFRRAEEIWAGEGEALGRLRPWPEAEADGESRGHLLHPAVLDAALHVLVAALGDDRGATFLPVEVGSFERLSPASGELFAHAKIRAAQGGGPLLADVTLGDRQGRVVARLEGLRLARVDASAWQQSRAARQVLFQIDWRPCPDAPAGRLGGVYLLAGPAGELADQLAARMRERGAEVLRSGDGPGEVASALSSLGARALAGAVWLPGASREQSVPERAERLAASGLALAQALLARGPLARGMLWVTRGAQAASPASPASPGASAMAHAALWGLGRAISREQPSLTTRLVDLDPSAKGGDGDEAGQIAAELSAGDEPEIALRGGQRLAPRLVRWAGGLRPLALPDGSDAAGTWLVTGGLGGLGLAVARWLWGTRKARLLLVSRRAPGAQAEQAIAELRASRAEVTVAQADVGRREEIEALLSAIPRSSPLRGVIHAAGVLDDGVLLEQSGERFHGVMAPKVAGAWHLHELTRTMPLEAFCLFSSAASVLGSAGQSSYAAANAFLDALAHLRRAEGLPASSVSFGPWSGAGMASRLEASHLARLARQGLAQLSPEQGLEALSTALAADAAHLAAIAFAPGALAGLRRAEAPALLRELASAGPRAAGSGQTALARKLRGAPLARRAELLEGELRTAAARVFALSPAEMPLDRPLKELGLDSLMAVELENAFRQLTGVALSATAAFDHPTLRALGRHLLDEMGLAEPDPPAAPSAPAAPPAAHARDASAAGPLPAEPAAPAAPAGPDGQAALSHDDVLDELQRELKELGALL